MNRRHGSCRSSWDIWMLRHGSGDMDLAEDPEIQRCWDMNAKTWIGHMDLAEDPEIRRCWDMNPKTWTYIRIRRHGSCRGSWDTYGCLYTDPETWILQRSLRYKNAETWAQRRGSCKGSILVDAETWIRRHGSCRESWDTYGCWDMSPKTWIL